MTIAHVQITQLYDVLRAHVPQGVARAAFLTALQETAAYKWNASFRATITRLAAHHNRCVSLEALTHAQFPLPHEECSVCEALAQEAPTHVIPRGPAR